MYVTSYKINNSYTTYVIHDYGEDTPRSSAYQKPIKPLEWKRGAKVNHTFHGIGKISKIGNNQITVHFSNTKAHKRLRNIQVTFCFKAKPSEIENLWLCY